MSEEINKLNICMSTMKKDIEYIKESLTDNKLDHEKMMEKIDRWIETSEKRFAPKWTADVIKWTGGVVGTAIILYILSKVLI